MNFWDNYHFAHPLFLLALLVIPVVSVWQYFRRPKQYVELTLSALKGVEKIGTWKGVLLDSMPYLRLIAFVSLVLALARPQQQLKEEKITADGIDIVLVMDLSSSMLARDFNPDRLEVSKQVAAQFIDKRPHDRIGLVVFSGEAFTQCPITTDHSVVKSLLAKLECGFLEDGTAIGMGIATGVNRLKDSPAKSKVLILLTDGVNNAGYIKPIPATELAQQFGIKTYTIGVGSQGDALTPVSRRAEGTYIFGLAQVEIDEALLTQISSMTGGKYFRATNEADLTKIYAEIDHLEKTKIEVLTTHRTKEAFRPFLFFGFLCILLKILLKYIVFKTIP